MSLRPLKDRYVRWMVLSGAAGLMYEVVIQKLFSYVIGASILSSTITIAAYMLGFSIGGMLAALLADRVRSPFRWYGGIEVLIGAGALVLVSVYPLFHRMSLTLDQHPWWRQALSEPGGRLTVCLLFLLPLTIPMGATLPFLGKAVLSTGTARLPSGRPSVTDLYLGNLVGAIAGTLLGAYLIIPYLGLVVLTMAGAACNSVVGISAWRETRRKVGAAPQPAPEDIVSPPAHSEHIGLRLAFFLSFLSGLVIFALEIVWNHLLASVVGTSTFAFSNMLVAVLAALALAALQEVRGRSDRSSLGRLVFTSAVALALTIPLFPLSGFVFSFFGLFRPGFYVREVVRLAVAGLIIVPPAYYLSRIFPRLLQHPALGASSAGWYIGWLTMTNTLGCLLGLFLARFVLVSKLGSEVSLRLAVAFLVATALLLRRTGPGVSWREWSGWSSSRRARVALVLGAASFVVPSWNLGLLLSGRNTYFELGGNVVADAVKYYREDAEGGHITVAVRKGITELRTNGKFEGSDGVEKQAQLSFGVLPALCARETGNAMVVGLGTGMTVRAVAFFPFQHIDVAELSPPIIEASTRFFANLNGHILDAPNVTTIHDDGRHALQMSSRLYDVISVELTSIWFAGAANLYNREFYELARARMAPGGVLQQWVQMHHMRFVDLWVLLHTVRAVFPHAVLWLSGNQGQLIASNEPIGLHWSRLTGLLTDQSNRYLVADDRQFILKMVGQLALDETAFDNLVRLDLASYIGESLNTWLQQSDLLVSSDLRPHLEYNTPKGNALDWTELFNVNFLKRFGRTAPVVPFFGLAADDAPLAGAVANIGRNDYDAARYWFEKSTAQDTELGHLVRTALESLETRSVFRSVQ